jgi:hypothetical protein
MAAGTRNKKTDNHFTADKAALRISAIQGIDRPMVLDVFGGHGVVWSAVGRLTGKGVRRDAIDYRPDLGAPHYHGDNRKILPGIDLSKYDVVDLDAYGFPVDLIRHVVVDARFKGVVVVTAIQTMHGRLPLDLIHEVGLPPEIDEWCKTLAARDGWGLLKQWLASIGVREIVHRSSGRKHYFYFNTRDQ